MPVPPKWLHLSDLPHMWDLPTIPSSLTLSTYSCLMTVQSKTPPVPAMKAYKWSRGIVPLILNLSTTQRWMVNFTLQIMKLLRPSFFWYIMQNMFTHEDVLFWNVGKQLSTSQKSKGLNYTTRRKPEISRMKLPSLYVLFLSLLGQNVSLSSLSWAQNS